METPAQSRPAAPAVVAVVVTRDAGPWLDQAVEALAQQDYSNLAVLFIDAASGTDPTPRIAAALPGAYVRRLDEDRGFGAAANHVGEIVDGAAFYCFLHDDAAPTPAAIRTMVNEAVRSNAGIVGCKLVRLDDHHRLLQVGESVDKTGERSTVVEPGELDQEQYDAVRDVFVVPGACTLVRADLFEAIGGFDEGIDLLNDDLSLCWRAHVAGARVVVAPDAVVGHAEALGERSDTSLRRQRLVRHRLRTMLSCYSRWHLVRVVPQAMFVAALEIVYSVLVGRRDQAGDVISAWRWNWRRRGEIRVLRRQVEAFRGVPDAEIRRFQVRGFSRVNAFFRGTAGGGGNHRSDRAQESWHAFTQGIRSGELRWPVAAWVVTLVIIAFGSRHLLLAPVAAVGGFLPFDEGPGDLLDAYLSGWRTTGLGSAAPAPTAFGLLALLGTVFLGAMGFLRQVLLLGAVLAGLVGAYRLLRPTGSPRAQAAALVVYGAIPVAYDAIADARWGSLAVYGAVPWLLGQLGRAAGWSPFGDVGGEPGPTVHPHRTLPRTATIGLLLALVAAIEPAVVPVVLVVLAGLALGSLLAGATNGVGRLLVCGIGGVVVAIVLHLPWALDFLLPGSTWSQVVGHAGIAEAPTLGALLRFDVGPVGGSALAYGFPLAGALPLLIGRDWRFEWAVRAWTVALGLIALTWAADGDRVPFALPPAETMLAPAAAGLALALGLGVVAFEQDLRAYHFGWRQIASILAGAALLVGAVPTLLDAGNGRWYLPAGDLDTTFAFLEQDEPGFRVLWVGHPDVLPLPGHALDLPGTDPTDEHVVFATSDEGLPSITDAWPAAGEGPTQLVADALGLAAEGQTSRLGRLLAPMAIRYVVVPQASAPQPLGGVQRPVPAAVVDTLGDQLDLAALPVNPAYTVYRNEAALTSPALVSATSGDGLAFDVGAEDLQGAEPVLTDREGPTRWTGEVPAGARVLHAAAADDGWELTVEGEASARTKLFGWAQGFEPEASGDAVLRYDTDPLRYGVLAVQLVLWVLALRWARRVRRRDDVVPTVAPFPASVTEKARS